MTFDLATVLVQWATGGLFFCWVTTRRREVGIGYGWLLRIVFGSMALIGVIAGLGDTGAGAAVRNVGAGLMVLCVAIALTQSVLRKDAGVRGQRAERDRRVARVAAMTGAPAATTASEAEVPEGPEFNPWLDLPGPAFGMIAIAGAAAFVGGNYALALFRLETGALFLGAVTDAMLLGHWYLVQPGLARDPIRELVVWTGALWPLEVAAYLIPVGMIQVLNGTVDDGYHGLIGWMWVVAAATTIGLVIATWFALKERSYSAVMAATGLLYLAILTGAGMELLPRALLS
jgi:hypothetical protein